MYLYVPNFFRKNIILDSQNNIENITIRQVGDDTVNVTFTRFDNTNDLNDVIITKVKRVFIMTQQQKQIQEQLNKLRAQSFTSLMADFCQDKKQHLFIYY